MLRGVPVRIQNKPSVANRLSLGTSRGVVPGGSLLATISRGAAAALAIGACSPGWVLAQPAPKEAPPKAAAVVTQAAPASAEVTPEGAYTVRLHDLEQRVNDLKEQIFRSKARLNLLKETVLHGVVAGARAVIVHRNDMGVMYQPVRLVYALDGAEIFSKADENGKLLDGKELEIYNGSLTPGNHTLSAQIVYRGNGFGVFSYLKGYQWRVVKSYNFSAPEGKVTSIKVVGFERGNAITTDPKDRPDLDFRTNSEADRADAAKKAK